MLSGFLIRRVPDTPGAHTEVEFCDGGDVLFEHKVYVAESAKQLHEYMDEDAIIEQRGMVEFYEGKYYCRQRINHRIS